MTPTSLPTAALVLPRPMREAVARLTDRIAQKGHGMSAYAAQAVELLLADSDRVELNPMQAATVRAAMNGARALGGPGVVPDSTLDVALRHAWAQLDQSAAEMLHLASARMRG